MAPETASTPPSTTTTTPFGNKQLTDYGRPNALVFSGNYIIPKPPFTDKKIIQQVVKDWQLGAVLRYQSGALLVSPSSLNGLEGQLDRTTGRERGLPRRHEPLGSYQWRQPVLYR